MNNAETLADIRQQIVRVAMQLRALDVALPDCTAKRIGRAGGYVAAAIGELDQAARYDLDPVGECNGTTTTASERWL